MTHGSRLRTHDRHERPRCRCVLDAAARRLQHQATISSECLVIYRSVGRFASLCVLSSFVLSLLVRDAHAQATSRDETLRLVGALARDTPLLRDLQSLADGIGGRATGSTANTRAVAWAL